MASANLQNINIYPIKSTAAIELSTSWVEELGLAFDRRFVVSTLSGDFISARTHPSLCLVQANLTANGAMLTAPDMPALILDYQKLNNNYEDVKVWKDTINAQQCSENINRWFSLYLKTPCKLLFFGEASRRFVKNRNTQVGFADGYPLLLISQASLDDLNSRISRNTLPIQMQQFRPNIVVNQCNAFAEDTWQHIRIGEVEFEITKPCTRCIFTTVDPNTAEQHPQSEPLKTLQKYRQLNNGDLLFGQNLVALNQGQIKQGDRVEVLASKIPPTFTLNKKPLTSNVDNSPSVEPETTLKKTKKPKITYTRYNKTITGNNEETLLTQGESAGLILPHSCRAGMCGRCKAQLTSGEVNQSCNDGLSDNERENGFILTCCSTPITDVTLEHPERKQRHIDPS